MSGDKFADHQAAEIHRLRRAVETLRHRIWTLEQSRALWRQRALKKRKEKR